jgi:hypothetical protein
MDAPVHIRHSQHLTAWVAHPQECKKCNSQYAIYTPSREEKSTAGMLIDSIKFISSWIPFSFQDSYMIGGSVILSSLYASYRLFSHKT